jgi:DNA-binding MarR family transcriptional regulator
MTKAAGTEGKTGRIEELLAELRRLNLGSNTAEWSNARFTLAQLRALAVVQLRQPITIGTLSAALGMSLASGSALADRLVRADVLRRSHDADDRRQVLLELTPSGLRFLRRIEQRDRTRLRKALAAMTPPERAGLETALAGFVRVLREQSGGHA